jgi:phosphorylcholine metabolism protein LicD
MRRIWQYILRIFFVYFFTLPGNYQNRKLKILREFYHLTNQFLMSLDIEYWLAYGTLLGYYREKDIIKHDIDLDFGATQQAYQVILNNQHKLPPVIKLFDTSKNHNGPKLFFSYKGFDTDIYFYDKKDNLLVPFLISSIPADMTPFDVNYIFPITKSDFLGGSTFIPADPLKYLEHCYGYIGKNAKFNKSTGLWEQRSN